MSGFFPPETSQLTSKDFFSSENKSAVTIVTLLLRHLQSSSCNAYEIDELVRRRHQAISEPSNIGGAVYATISLSNHSCAPNTIRYDIFPRKSFSVFHSAFSSLVAETAMVPRAFFAPFAPFARAKRSTITTGSLIKFARKKSGKRLWVNTTFLLAIARPANSNGHFFTKRYGVVLPFLYAADVGYL